MAVRVSCLNSMLWHSRNDYCRQPSKSLRRHFLLSSSSSIAAAAFPSGRAMATSATLESDQPKFSFPIVIDSHLHVWASPQEAEQKYPYFPGQEPTLPGDVDFLLQCMNKGGVDGALIVQPINHKFDHSYVTSVLKKYPSKFVGCCLANPTEDEKGVKDFEDLILKDGYRAVRFNPYLWPSGQQMTNNIGKAIFSKAGELGVPVGFMCMKGLNLHLLEIEELCTEFPKTTVILDHLAFCKPPTNDEDSKLFSALLKLSRFPQVYVKFSALFRVSRVPYPYDDLSKALELVVSSFSANRVMWGR
ncbi:OLC1v1028566C2 [Oldenlandia corymbosa var. corymbosa]|uniref:OLC1v1028566C2 n=1 Tax=Oldenlandia corymbosa var. corymbosa TaxID=529605 RepID=A0AAV1CEP0_OLDCO|nr:OLC1v1028566C2 [Oldenlandia corymbosa var. corymbosa]